MPPKNGVRKKRERRTLRRSSRRPSFREKKGCTQKSLTSPPPLLVSGNRVDFLALAFLSRSPSATVRRRRSSRWKPIISCVDPSPPPSLRSPYQSFLRVLFRSFSFEGKERSPSPPPPPPPPPFSPALNQGRHCVLKSGGKGGKGEERHRGEKWVFIHLPFPNPFSRSFLKEATEGKMENPVT